MSGWQHDIRSALRRLATRPRFAAVVILTLAVAIGVNTLIFSFVNVLVLEPLPLQHPDRVVLVYSTNMAREVSRGSSSLPDFLDWRAATTSFEYLAAGEAASFSLADARGPIRVRAQRVTTELFPAWGLTPVLGRMFRPGEDGPGAAPVVVLSHGFWTRHFGSDPGAIGGILPLAGRPHTIVGVLTPDIEIGTLSLIDVWTPLPLDVADWPRGRRTLQVTGLLRPGVAVRHAAAELEVLSRHLAEAYPPTNAGWSAHVLPFTEAMTVPDTWLVLALASLAAALVLLVACANVASLMLARGVERRTEVAVRLALGASQLQIVQLVVLEALLVAAIGGAAGLLLALGGLDLVRAVTYEPFFRQVRLDQRVLGFAVALSFASPLLFAVGPALKVSRLRINTVLQQGGAGSTGGAGGQRAHGVLIVGQIALALVLVAVSVLTVRTAVELRRVDLGFDRTRTLALRLDLPPSTYETPEHLMTFHDRLLERLAGLPGVQHTGATSRLPVFDARRMTSLTVYGHPVSEPDTRPWAVHAAVGGEYFRALDLPLLDGRYFSQRDTPGAAGVAIISAEAARRYWNDPESALGARIGLGDADPPESWLEVVGVVSDVGEAVANPVPQPYVYVPFTQHPERHLAFVVRTIGTPAAVAPAARAAVHGIDADQAVDVRTLEQMFDESLANNRLTAGFFAMFALVALVLASGGLYGLMSYSVAQRTGEIGLRIVLGARPADILSLVVGRGLWLAGTGVGIGLPAAVLFARTLSSLVYGVDTKDPSTYLAVVVLFGVIAVLACYLPAQRAMRVDPSQALRSQ